MLFAFLLNHILFSSFLSGSLECSQVLSTVTILCRRLLSHFLLRFSSFLRNLQSLLILFYHSKCWVFISQKLFRHPKIFLKSFLKNPLPDEIFIIFAIWYTVTIPSLSVTNFTASIDFLYIDNLHVQCI